jgi:hypothetical protein
MKSKLFVGTLLAAVVLTAGAAEAQAPTVNTGNLKKGTAKVYNVTADATTIISLEAFFVQANTDGDIVVFDETDARVAGRSTDTDGAIGIFNSTVGGYEAGSISVVAGTTVVVCIVHESGPGAKFTMVSSSKSGSGIASGGVRAGASFRITEAGEFDLYGSAAPEFVGIQDKLQRIVGAKR